MLISMFCFVEQSWKKCFLRIKCQIVSFSNLAQNNVNVFFNLQNIKIMFIQNRNGLLHYQVVNCIVIMNL